MNTNKIKGKRGEDIAAKFLIDKGFEILETNYYASRYGEIDIIAKHKDTLVFVEVKARSTNDYGHPLESITQTKLQKMHKAISFYISEKKPKMKNYRMDAVAITFKPKLEILHIENILQ
ncbi:MAG: YraN family protein [bacterium]